MAENQTDDYINTTVAYTEIPEQLENSEKFEWKKIKKQSGKFKWSKHPIVLHKEYKDVQVQVHNGRNKEFELDTHGFCFTKWKTELSFNDFYEIDNDHEIRNKFFEEMERYAIETLDADYAQVYHYRMRDAKHGQNTPTKEKTRNRTRFSGPSTFVHVDQTMSTADNKYFEFIKDHPEVAADSSNKRYLLFNIWRNIDSENPVKNHHLALCHQNSVDAGPENFLLTANKKGHELNVRSSQNHKWYYFPAMVRDEIVCHKQADSDFRVKARMCFHTAVEDPSASENDPPRQSIEARIICVFKNQDMNTVPEIKSGQHRVSLEDWKERYNQQN